MNTSVIGICGAGRAGTAFARLALRADYDVDICSTRPPRALQHHLKIYAPGARPVPPEEVATRSLEHGPGLVILAVPQEELDEVDPAWFGSAVLVDATNRWHAEPLPGWLQAAVDEQLPTSMAIAARMRPARLVKALNHLAHQEIEEAATHTPPRAVALATDDDDAAETTQQFLSNLGFTPVRLGALPAGRIMEPDGPLFNRVLNEETLREYIR